VDFGGGTLTAVGGNDLAVVKLDPSGGHLWSRRFGHSGYDQVHALAADPAGNVYFAGNLDAPVDFGGGTLSPAGSADAYVVKLEASQGAHAFSRKWGGGDSDIALDVAADAGGVSVVGFFRGAADFGGGLLVSAGDRDAFVVRLDGAGDHLFSRHFGSGGDDRALAVATDEQGNTAVGGRFESSIDFGAGPMPAAGGMRDAFVVKLGASGEPTWAKVWGGPNHDSVEALATGGAGGHVIVAGLFTGTVDFGAGPFTAVGSDDPFLVVLAP
jgi:hypothetical protein